MIVPQPQQQNIFSKIAVDYNYRFSNLFQNFSPILPLHFDKSYLPKNICQRQLIELFQCTVFKQATNSESCSYYIGRFQYCRKNRDIQILQGIKKWESKHIQSLDKTNRQLYLQGLTFKLDRLKQEYSKMPSTSKKQFKLHQIQTQIEQLKWRMKNIQNILKQQQKNQQKTKK